MFLHFTLLPPPHLLALMQLCVGYTENQLLSSTSGTLSSFKDDSPAKELKICLCREEFIWKISPRVRAVLVIDLLCTFKICISFFYCQRYINGCSFLWDGCTYKCHIGVLTVYKPPDRLSQFRHKTFDI